MLILNPILIFCMMLRMAYVSFKVGKVFVACLSQDGAPVSGLSYSNQAVPVERVILNILDRPVARKNKEIGNNKQGRATFNPYQYRP
jgi:hypothetical protein